MLVLKSFFPITNMVVSVENIVYPGSNVCPLFSYYFMSRHKKVHDTARSDDAVSDFTPGAANFINHYH